MIFKNNHKFKQRIKDNKNYKIHKAIINSKMTHTKININNNNLVIM